MRETGRTYRRVIKSLLSASSGKHVFFYVGSDHELYHIKQRLDKHKPDGALWYNNKLLFPNRGFVRVTPAHEDVRGLRCDFVVTDELYGMCWRQVEKLMENIKHVQKGETK